MDKKKTFFDYKVLKLLVRSQLLLLLFVLSFVLLGQDRMVRGSYVVAGVQTHISFSYDDKNYEFDTYKTSLVEAIGEQGISVYDQDLFNIPRDTRLNGQGLEVLVTKSLPVLINDNGNKILGRAVYSEPEKILEQNQIKVWPEDIISADLILNPVAVGGVGQLITIKRAPVYTVAVDGKSKEVRSWDKSVRTIVEKSETKLNPNDTVSPGLEENASTGTKIVITRINYADISENVSIPFETIYQGSTALVLGKTSPKVSGITGSKRITYRITYKDGEEVARKTISTIVTTQKRDAVILRGAEKGSTNWGWYDGYVTSFYRATASMVGKHLLVTNLDNGKTVTVRIIGNGPFTGQLMDMSRSAFIAIGGDPDQGRLYNVMVQLID